MGADDLATCPYRGLSPYTEADAEFFFGRTADRDLVIANLMASRLTVLYGPSGVGKSSLLQAGVLRRLREGSSGRLRYRAAGRAVSVYHASWAKDPLVGLGAALREAVPPPLAGQAFEPAGLPPDAPLSVALLGQVSERLGADIYLLLDQFEEITLYQNDQRTEAFAAELGRIVADPGLRVRVLIGVREDVLAKLDRFTPYVPGVLDNYLRLDHLPAPAAREAIERPLQRYNEDVDEPERMDLENGLVDDLLAQLRTGRVTVGDVGQGGVEDVRRSDAATIETPFLQLVMTRLWATERAGGSTTLRRETLRRLGGAEGIVRNHLDVVMGRLTENQVAVAARVLRYLVTPSGSKIANSAEALTYFAGLADPAEVTEVLEALSGGGERILRHVPAPMDQPGKRHYEVFHDVLAPAVLDWRRRYVAAQERAEAEAALVQAKARAEASRRALLRTRLLGAIVVVCLVTAIAGLAVGLIAVKQGRDGARLRALMATYEYQLGYDPGAALHAALEAYRIRPAEASSAVSTALEADLSERTLRGHRGLVMTGEYSHDGRSFITTGQDGTVRVVDAKTGSLRPVLDAEPGAARSGLTGASLSPDGSRFVATSKNGRIRVVDARSGRVERIIDDYHDPVTAEWVSVGGATMLLASANQTSGSVPQPATLYDPGTGRAIRRFGAPVDGGPSVGAYQARLSRDGSRVVTLGFGTTTWDASVSVWDTATGRLLARSRSVGDYAIDPHFVGADSSRIALLRQKPGIGVWNLAFWTWPKGAATGAFQPDDWNAQLTSSNLAVSPDGKTVAAGLDKQVGVYDAMTGKSTGFTPEHPDWVNAVRFSPDGRLMATAGNDGQIRLWRPGTNNRPVAQLLGHRGAVVNVAFNPTDPGALASVSGDGTVRTWRLPARTVLPNDDWVLRVASTRDGGTLLTGLRTGYLKVWTTGGSEAVKTIPLPDAEGFLQDAVLAPDDNTVVATASQQLAPFVVRWRDPGRHRPMALDMTGSTDRLTVADVSPDSRQVAAGNQSNQVVIWDLASRKVVRTLPRLEDGSVTAVAYLGTAGQLAVASSDGTVRIWDAGQQRPRTTLEMPGRMAVSSMGFTPDQRHVITASQDHVLRIWRLPDGRPEGEFAGPVATPGRLSFTADGSLLALGASDAAVHIYVWREKRELGVIRAHGDAVNDVRFLPDGRILSGSDDGTAAIYPCLVCLPMAEVARQAEARDRLHEQRGDNPRVPR